MIRRDIKKVVFVEPKSTHLHVYSRITIPRLGSVLLGTIMRNKGYDVRVYIEDIAPVDMAEVLSADFVAISADHLHGASILSAGGPGAGRGHPGSGRRDPLHVPPR